MAPLTLLQTLLAFSTCHAWRTRTKTKDIAATTDAAPSAGKTSCALFCHEPPPWHRWRDSLEDRCAVDTSLFLDADATPWMLLKDTFNPFALDLLGVAHRAAWTSGDATAEEKAAAAQYEGLKNDLEVVQGVLFGKVIDLGASKRVKIATKPWEPMDNENEARCIASAALGEVKRLAKTGYALQPDEYKAKRDHCVDSEPVTMERVHELKQDLEGLLDRTAMIANSGGREKLLADLDRALPPASEPCTGDLKDCLQSRFVDVTTWSPPSNLHHEYGYVVFAGCHYGAFQPKAVETAMQLVAPGGKIIIDGWTPEHLENEWGLDPFVALRETGWTMSTETKDWSTITSWSPP